MGEEPKDLAAEKSLKKYDESWKNYAEAFAQPLQGNGLLSRFVSNPAVTGAYAESWVRSIIRSMLGHRFRISTGAVVKSSDYLKDHKIPQCDIIIWDPSELPAVFESGEFALVPWFSARAIIEVKRTISSVPKLDGQLGGLKNCLKDYGPILGVVIQHGQPLFSTETLAPDWFKSYKYDISRPAFDHTKKSPVTRLLDLEGKPDTEGIMVFIYFLAQVAGHSRATI